MTSAACSARSAFSVSSSGSPGPAPTSSHAALPVGAPAFDVAGVLLGTLPAKQRAADVRHAMQNDAQEIRYDREAQCLQVA